MSYTPTTSGVYRVAAMQRNAKGAAAFDDLQLERSVTGEEEAASSANLLQMGAFEFWNSAAASNSFASTYWSSTGTASYGGTDSRSGYSLKLTGSVSGKTRASQTVPINASSDNTFLLSAWAKAYSAPNCAAASEMTGDNEGGKRFFGLIARVSYSDGTDPDYHYIPFEENYTGWQYASGMVVPTQSGKTVSTITVTAAYDYNVNTCCFDEIGLTQEPAQTYAYDENGNLEAVNSATGSDDAYTYDGADLTKAVMAGYGTYTYEYDDAHNLTSATNDGVTVTYSYDTMGNNTKSVLRKGTSGVYLQSSASYTSDGNNLASVKDANGVTVSYGTPDSLDRTTSVTANGMTTSYSYYSGNNRVKSTSFGSSAVVEYSYSKGSLSAVNRHDLSGTTTPWQRYAMTMDGWGNVTKIQVQGASASDTVPTSWNTGITLASYSYAGNNGYLEKMTYGNGAYVTYDYDRFSRLIGEEHYSSAGVLQYRIVYVYDGNGNTAICRVYNGSDTLTDEYRYEYDSLGRLIRSWQTDGTGTVMNTEHTYDIQSRLLSQTWQIGDASFTESYTYDSDDGSMASMTTASGETLTYGYDTIKRLSTVTAKTASSATIYKQTLAYKTISGSQTSTQVSSLTYSSLDDTTSYAYTYDANGRISRETYATGAYTAYSYDALNQLRFATMYNSSGVADYRYKYYYDNSGNLVNWFINNNDNTETYENHTYTYGNTSWADLLTAFDGYGIAYEGQTYNSTTNTVTGTAVSGNPISYYNGTRWTFGWSNGRQLTSASKTGTSISYAYDLNGLRTSKTVNGVKHTYYYAGGMLLRETYGSNVLDFAYTASGAPFSLTYNGTTYYYITNQMGDVMYLVNASGTRVAAYTYDPYGKVLTATGTMASINPLRYRGYYYDMETGLYYVSSRYYDPEIGRWINADIPETLTADFENFAQYNLFAYCFNNPVNMSDETGTWPSWAKKVVAAVAVVAVVATVAAVTVATAGAGTAAAVIAVGAAKGAAIGMASGAAIGAATGAVSHRVSTGSWSGAGTAALNGMGDGALSGAVTGAITGAAGSAVKVSQAAKAWDSGTFKSGYQSMKYHYNKHVVSEGLTKRNNVLKYTQDAVRFANRNSSVLKYTYNYNYGNASWNLTYSTGQGGMFTSAGKILTFWYR